jgi:DNA-directed RNA polymerase subunit A"
VDARKTPKNPVMEVYLNKGAKDYEAVKKIASKIEEITLDKIASIEENFESKSVSVKLDEQAMKDLRISEDEVLEKIKEITAYEKRGSALVVKKEEESLKNLRKLSMKLGGIHLRGLKGISRAIIIEKEEKGKHGDKEKEIEYAIATEGTNLEEILKIPEVDASRTTTNDIAEIARVFGIEAGRNAIVEEIRKVMEAQELKVDMRHIMLIADAMTYKGAVKSVGRHGLAGEKKSVLARAAFEETSKHLLSACVAEESDDLKGVTENILIGQTIPVGTGTVEVQMKIEE